MYFPYLRGRQYELIAIRELVEKELISNKIIPVIEPVKLSRTLIKTIAVYNERGTKLLMIENPEVGNFSNDISDDNNAELIKQFNDAVRYENIIHSIVANNTASNILKKLVSSEVKNENIATISFSRDNLNDYTKLFADVKCGYNLIPDDRRFSRSVETNKVLFENRFKKRKRNADYDNIDEFYSDDHLYFTEEGYMGFSDYSIVGDEYSESGFAPYSVAIHIVYFNSDDELKVVHFVSDSNDDIRDPANKFYEAVTKLYQWGNDKSINTYGYNELINHYHNQTYPGLGVVKKLSIMHHIELVSNFLER